MKGGNQIQPSSVINGCLRVNPIWGLSYIKVAYEKKVYRSLEFFKFPSNPDLFAPCWLSPQLYGRFGHFLVAFSKARIAEESPFLKLFEDQWVSFKQLYV